MLQKEPRRQHRSRQELGKALAWQRVPGHCQAKEGRFDVPHQSPRHPSAELGWLLGSTPSIHRARRKQSRREERRTCSISRGEAKKTLGVAVL